MVKCKITEVVPLSKINENPVLLHFQNGRVQPAHASANLDCLLARNTSTDEMHAIAAQQENVYSGCVGAGYRGDLQRNFIGIRNKRTNKMRLIEVQQCSMLGKHYLAEASAASAAAQAVTSTEQAYKIMLKTYGGKAANRMLEKKEKMRLNVDVVRDQLDRTVNESTTTMPGQKTMDADGTVVVAGGEAVGGDAFDVAQAEREEVQRKMIPRLNEQAKRLEEVYRLEDLIDADLLERMEADALAVVRSDREDLPITAQYLLDIIKQVQETKAPESPDNLRRIKVCIYLDALINFLRGVRNTRQNMKETNFSDIAERVETDIRQKFRQPDTLRIVKTNYIQHKTICWVVILSLLISDKFELDTARLVEAINTPKSHLFTLTNVVAVRRKPKTDLLVLKLPSQLRSGAAAASRRKSVGGRPRKTM